MDVKIAGDGARIVISVAGRLNTTTAPDFNKAVQDAVDKADDVTVDLKGLEFISSAGIRSIMTIRSRKGAQNVHIVNAAGLVREVFEVSGIAGILES